jgi:outer membrane protein
MASPAQAQKFKVGVVDLQTVLDTSARGKSAKDRLKALGEKLQKEIQSKRDLKEKKEAELQKMRGDIQSKGLVLNTQARIDQEEEFRKKIRELKRYIDDTNNFIEDSTREFREREVRETQLILAEVRKVVREIGDREGFTFILESNENTAVVLYAHQSIDITSQVVQRFDQASAAKR